MAARYGSPLQTRPIMFLPPLTLLFLRGLFFVGLSLAPQQACDTITTDSNYITVPLEMCSLGFERWSCSTDKNCLLCVLHRFAT
jgi:hypothetical protein